ncbi:MerR family transcriptional regulator [Pullulanibacillus camelliae]|uniref:MerR family transcriptional regulator n=1 Tax=Pullulanibacillus camelliae TaxID=1707096 RepID=A0A8J2VN00_9BACL|nr:MerR family transcriptional regulator [Pullulanibacillus camelliae]GGE33482.1 MerR family transcriptional regulator [Pullulanibacillus camelliae]
MLYTVKELSRLANVTVKTLHHYHKISLLIPCQLSDAGYRLYGQHELERLQHILFYRALDFPLKEIKHLLDNEPDRLSLLTKQRTLLLQRLNRTKQLVQTIEKSITFIKKGEAMEPQTLFDGFNSEEEWRDALKEQNTYLKETYNVDLLKDEQSIDVQEMNSSAQEATHFLKNMAEAMIDQQKVNEKSVRTLIGNHIDFLNAHGHQVDPSAFAQQCRFFLQDDFHRTMLEEQQPDLAYYLCIAAEAFAEKV